MVKTAADMQPGDVIMWNGKPAIVESVTVDGVMGVSLKLHTRFTEQNVQSSTTFLVSDRYTITAFVQAVEAGL